MSATETFHQRAGLVIHYILLILTTTCLVIYIQEVRQELVEITAKQNQNIIDQREKYDKRLAEFEGILEMISKERRKEMKLKQRVVGRQEIIVGSRN